MIEAFNVLNREARRLERMVSEMLSVAEIEAGSMRLSNDDVKLDRVFSELETDFKPFAAEKQINLTFALPPKLPDFFADRDRLTLAIHNLVGNAIKYTPAGGSVTVTLSGDGGKLNIDVTDTGIGITQAELAPIFDRFYRAKDPRVANITGSGLGLALAREVARLHGGDVTVQSELNKGSTFTLSVPLTAPPARTGTKQAA
jgi:two-component system sensor histidine kinase VicK